MSHNTFKHLIPPTPFLFRVINHFKIPVLKIIPGIMKLSDTMATPIEEKLDQNLKVNQKYTISDMI